MRARFLVRSVTVGGLSRRLLILTLFFVMVSEVLIYVPSIARFRITYLEDRVAAAQLASFALIGEPERLLTPELEQDVLDEADIVAIVIKTAESRALILGENTQVPQDVAATFDLRQESLFVSIVEAFRTMVLPDRTIRVIGAAFEAPDSLIDIVIMEQPLRTEMFSFSGRVLALSLLISVITGALVFLALHLVIVRPLRRLTQDMVEFRNDPEAVSGQPPDKPRVDEIGVAQHEFGAMREELRLALRQKTRLAELGTAVSKINHDLRNILATAQLVSDRLAESGDPDVRRATPVLLRAIDRAIELCTHTLQFGRAREQEPQRGIFALRELIDDVSVALGLGGDSTPRFDNRIPTGLRISADQEQLFRVFMNLGRNAAEVLAGRPDGRICVSGAPLGSSIVLEFFDSGPGIPEDARDKLFQPFAGTTKSSGTGLGLAIARDLVEGHGGTLVLHRSDDSGTTFRIDLPTNIVEIASDRDGRTTKAV